MYERHMYDRDDIDLLYILEPHGWSTCLLHTRDRVYPFDIIYVFGDPIYDLIEATIWLLRGCRTNPSKSGKGPLGQN